MHRLGATRDDEAGIFRACLCGLCPILEGLIMHLDDDSIHLRAVALYCQQIQRRLAQFYVFEARRLTFRYEPREAKVTLTRTSSRWPDGP